MGLLMFSGVLLVGSVIAHACQEHFSTAATAACKPPPPTAPRDVVCGLLGGAIAITEILTLMSSGFGFNGNKRMDLEGTDFCETGGEPI